MMTLGFIIPNSLVFRRPCLCDPGSLLVCLFGETTALFSHRMARTGQIGDSLCECFAQASSTFTVNRAYPNFSKTGAKSYRARGGAQFLLPCSTDKFLFHR